MKRVIKRTKMMESFDKHGIDDEDGRQVINKLRQENVDDNNEALIWLNEERLATNRYNAAVIKQNKVTFAN